MPALATVVVAWSNNQSWGPATLLLLVAVISLVGAIVASRIIARPETAQEEVADLSTV